MDPAVAMQDDWFGHHEPIVRVVAGHLSSLNLDHTSKIVF
jgi:hypothetical protein